MTEPKEKNIGLIGIGLMRNVAMGTFITNIP